MSTALDRLKQLDHELPTPAPPRASYIPVTRVGDILYVSGQVSEDENGIVTGTLGADMDVAAGQKAAERAALYVLAQIAGNGGVALEKVRIVKLLVLVASTPDFDQHHLVANGASELIAAVLGEPGRHARSAIGVAALPLGAAVEIEAIVEVGT